MERLSQGPASVSQLAEPVKMTLAGVVQHLQVLEASGLIHTEKHGRVRTCHINPEALAAVEQWVTERRAFWQTQFDRLDSLLAETPSTSYERKRKR